MKVMNVWMLKQLVLIFIIVYTHTYIHTYHVIKWPTMAMFINASFGLSNNNA